ncbi:hypothetical protein ACFXHA_29635 [Nocardia sp. NPDC059240]|uniref:hypothetical protein n=1 Tax=Nocardia sp. NPDC059240 TaxID=3346786 RepID=UPI0036B25FFB
MAMSVKRKLALASIPLAGAVVLGIVAVVVNSDVTARYTVVRGEITVADPAELGWIRLRPRRTIANCSPW